MTEKNELPDGYSFSLPKPPPPGAKTMSFEEVEGELLIIAAEREAQLRQAYYKLVVLYHETGRYDKELVYIQTLIGMATNVGEKAHYFLTLGQLMEKLSDFAAAVDYYTQARALEPVDQQVWYFIHNNLGYSLNMLGRYDEGEHYCRLALRINPKLYNAHKNLGMALEGQNRPSEAAACYIEAVKADATNQRAFHHLENLLQKTPNLLKENPLLANELENARQATGFAQKTVQDLLDKYYQPD